MRSPNLGTAEYPRIVLYGTIRGLFVFFKGFI